MLIRGTSITVTYKKITGIKKVYYNNEEILKPFFNEATVLPVPDDAPLEIPRIIIKTLNEHAQLNISPIASTFEIHYDAGFERNWEACSHYIVERMGKVFEFLNKLTNDTYEYLGLITNVLYDEIDQHGAEVLSRNLLNSQNIRNLFDINIRYTFVEEGDIFTNITLQNARLFNAIAEASGAGMFGLQNQTSESIGAIIDINDRYGFNTDINHKSDSSTLQTLIKSMDNVLNNKLKNLIEKGEY